jgi:hypothetical protein
VYILIDNEEGFIKFIIIDLSLPIVLDFDQHLDVDANFSIEL